MQSLLSNFDRALSIVILWNHINFILSDKDSFVFLKLTVV